MVLTFVGLELDSAKMQARIPMAKIHELTEKISHILSKTKERLRDIQSLIGSLNFCCRAIPAGRPFCRRLINATCGLTKPFLRIRIRRDIKLDFRMWLQFFLQITTGYQCFTISFGCLMRMSIFSPIARRGWGSVLVFILSRTGAQLGGQ